MSALVLAVDDTPEILRACERLALGLPLRLICVASADEALAQMAIEVPTLVISDFKMPGMDGIELLKRVRLRWPSVRVVLHSGDGNALRRAAELGFGAVRKPDESFSLRTCMSDVC